jgi:hypothetical protein
MTAKLRVKIISKNTIAGFQLFDLPQFFADKLVFVTDRQARDYDWLVVYDDLPPRGDERLSLGEEILACPRANTALITYEPSSLKFYGDDYIKQFGLVLTSQGVDYLAHDGRCDMPPVGFWYYGGMAQLAENDQVPEKTALISMFGSPKAEKFTLHQRRAEFLVELADALGGQVDVFGKGHRWVEHKAEGIDAYRYHIAVENHIGPHHWTEKLSDAFLGYSLPFYVGCSNAADYFPEDSFIALDIRDTQETLARIRQAVADNEYERRLPAIIEARRRVLEDYNLGNMVARHILAAQEDTARVALPVGAKNQNRLLSRHATMRQGLGVFLRYALGKRAARRQGRRFYADYLAGRG